ncbi:transporter substrate-binding domain-containing protein [Endozoicomonas sp. SM1973]|uniref:Transporter substrate-binding domain-containing protein n=1 Tax=Spartinivicinus marinus TaxID=2994442 RepID=A0A853I359_9GAMM|nr:transporter substrate-binding domain-containing protein [Spartinivicinus marinus]MCX4029573.1 transporter substrate-binding domain-containing protein [Spartinivicinus marinus]NYZ65148.1 transporter substrate-binding domain-containing protein [Spartinivicinus marinus]
MSMLKHYFLLLLGVWSISIYPLMAKEIKIAYNSDWPPYSYIDKKDGVVKGILVDLLNSLFVEQLSIKTINYGFPWKRVQSEAKSGLMDAFITVPTEPRLAYALRSRNIVYTLKMQAITRQDKALIDQISRVKTVYGLNTFNVCEIIGNGWGYRFWQQHNVKFQAVPKVSNCLLLIAKGRADLMIHPLAVGSAELSRLKLTKKLIILPKVYGEMKFTLLLSKQSNLYSQALVDEFDQVIDKLKREQAYQPLLDAIMAKVTAATW